MTKILIIDDEPLARYRIAELLKQDPDILMLGECKNGAEAVRAIQQKRPDIIFLDIQMPDLTGFDVVSHLKTTPLIIFVTAFDQYALKAFDIHAIDYLLKPFTDQRFQEALDRAKSQLTLQQTSQFSNKLLNLMEEFYPNQDQYLNTLTIKDRGQDHQIDLDDVLWIESDGNYLALNLQDKRLLHRSTMNAFETEVSPAKFLRIHRSYMVNIMAIQNTQYLTNNAYEFELTNGQKLVSGRHYKDTIQAFLAQNT